MTQTVTGAAGARVTLTDAQGHTLLDETVPCAFSSLILSTPGLAVGDAVTLSVDGAETAITVSNQALSGFGGMGGMGGFGGMGGGRGTMGGQRPDMSGQTGGQIPDRNGQTDGQLDTQRPDMSGQTDAQRPTMGGQRHNMGGQWTQTGGQTAAQAAPVDRQTILLTAISALLLLAGIFIAAKTKH